MSSTDQRNQRALMIFLAIFIVCIISDAVYVGFGKGTPMRRFSRNLDSSRAASFRCMSIPDRVERIVCGSVKLSQLNGELSDAYSHALQTTPDKQALTREQNRWGHDVRDACADSDCLTQAYTARLQELKGKYH